MKDEFKQEFDHKVLTSERLRALALAIVATVSLSSFVITKVFFAPLYQQTFGRAIPIELAFTFLLSLILYELTLTQILTGYLRRRQHPPFYTQYLNALIETSMPTLAMVLLGQNLPAYVVLASPIPFAYFLFILVSPLRLDSRLCVFTGVVASLEFIGFSLFYAFQPAPNSDYTISVLLQLQKGLILLLAGGGTGLVAYQVRQQILDTLQSMEETRHIMQLFGKQVSPAVVNRLLQQPADMDGEIRYVCIMFLDIRGFTQFCEHKSPEQVVAYLNQLFGFMIETVNRHNGIINKFLGDGFMAVFGAPLSNGNDSRHAVAAALEMIEQVHQAIALGTIPPTRIGIGLHAGEVVTGNVGSVLRQEYTVIGEVVNLAARIEQLNKEFKSQLLVSETVWEAIAAENIQPTALWNNVSVRGLATPMTLYQLA